jgi:hypothetical protein
MSRSLTIAMSGWVLGVTLAAVACAAPAPKLLPEIFAIDPPEGSAGTVIKVKGSGFDHTKQVLFSAGRTGQQAKFKVVSDTELEVTAPPYFHAGTSATLVVVTPNGATVGMPASVLEVDHNLRSRDKEATFYHVLAGGTVDAPEGIVLVENGGVASAPASVAIGFVKNGGTLLAADRFPGLIVAEPRANLQTGPHPSGSTTRVMKVPQISTSLGIEPFVYYRPDSPDTPAESAPHVRSVSPGRVPRGGIVALHGTGFFGTSEVMFVGSDHDKVANADFQVVSDTQLDVEIPETPLLGNIHLVVVNAKGATLVVPQNDLSSHHSQPRKPASIRHASLPRIPSPPNPVAHVDARGLMKDAGRHNSYFVEGGGRVVPSGDSGVYFVKNGGRIEGPHGRALVFYEPGAKVSTGGPNANADSDREVETVSLSVVPTGFVIVPP